MFKTLFSLFLGMGVFCCTLLGQDAPPGDAPVVAEAAVTQVAAPAATAAEPLNTGDQAWMLACSAMVLLMTPGLAFFYGGLVGRKNVLSILMQCFMCMCMITILWVVCGYSIAFSGTELPGPGGPFIGDPSHLRSNRRPSLGMPTATT